MEHTPPDDLNDGSVTAGSKDVGRSEDRPLRLIDM